MRRKIGGSPKTSGKVTGKRKVTHRRKRHRRVNGANDIGGMAIKVLALGAGAIAARELNTVMVNFMPTLKPLYSGLIQVAAGVALGHFVKGPFFANMADGMQANGIMVTAVSTGLINGPSTASYRIAGPGRALNVINGPAAGLSVVNGPQTRVNNIPGLVNNLPRVTASRFDVIG